VQAASDIPRQQSSTLRGLRTGHQQADTVQAPSAAAGKDPFGLYAVYAVIICMEQNHKSSLSYGNNLWEMRSGTPFYLEILIPRLC
jgi:hypothetical protein